MLATAAAGLTLEAGTLTPLRPAPGGGGGGGGGGAGAARALTAAELRWTSLSLGGFDPTGRRFNPDPLTLTLTLTLTP